MLDSPPPFHPAAYQDGGANRQRACFPDADHLLPIELRRQAIIKALTVGAHADVEPTNPEPMPALEARYGQSGLTTGGAVATTAESEAPCVDVGP